MWLGPLAWVCVSSSDKDQWEGVACLVQTIWDCISLFEFKGWGEVIKNIPLVRHKYTSIVVILKEGGIGQMQVLHYNGCFL